MLGQAYAHAGNFPKSIEAAKRFVELSQNSGYAQLELAYSYAMAGNQTASDHIVSELTDRGRRFSPYAGDDLFGAA